MKTFTLDGTDLSTEILDGQLYYRRKRAELVKLIITAAITENDADFIDAKLERVQLKLNTGDWKSAKKRLLEVVVELCQC